jgi:anion-transporting  ArsA/GET3 family ATPase
MDAPGELWATMLDAKRTFDDLVETYAPDVETRDAVLANPIYRELSNAVAGSQEYMAMEKLHELHQEGRYDLLVLDTPPTRNALDFLEAPRRLARFIDSRSLQFFRAGGRMGLGVMGRGTGLLFSALQRATGVDLLRDLSDFFNSFGAMSDGFRDRARRVEALLGDSRTTFLLVTSARETSIREAEWFARRLREEDLPFGGVVVNRVRQAPGASPSPQLRAELERRLGAELGDKVTLTLGEQVALAERDAGNLAGIGKRLGRKPTIAVPEMPADVHDLEGLRALNQHLF